MTDDPSVVGYVVSVRGFKLKVEVLKETRSPSRATFDGVQTVVAINSYLTFPIGAGKVAIGIITDLEARESYDPASGEELTLELLKARRIVEVQLLGTAEKTNGTWSFNPGITVLPTLDIPAKIGTPEMLAAVFENPPKRNKPQECNGKKYDDPLELGTPTGQANSKVKASYNDLFSRPLAIVGNTGSGKSYSVTSLLQKAMDDKVLGTDHKNAPHIFILDINGEYARAFPSENDKNYERSPDQIYLNGKPFGIPLWFFNAEEICIWLSASEQTQEPVLKNWWAVIKSDNATNLPKLNMEPLREASLALELISNYLDDTSHRKNSDSVFKAYEVAKLYLETYNRAGSASIKPQNLCQAIKTWQTENEKNSTAGRDVSWLHPSANVRVAMRNAIAALNEEISTEMSRMRQYKMESTADWPIKVKMSDLTQQKMIGEASSSINTSNIENHLTTLYLRLTTRLADKRWQAFLNYEEDDTKFDGLEDWFKKFGFGDDNPKRVSVIDLSMLSHEVLPYACAIIGRILLDARERLPADTRYKHPWVLVLEEAHNYARPARQQEERAQALSRRAFERIAKEGRKFGLSLIVASQRPSEISPTIISQCANFISHSLQNPDDIDHFRRIIPTQARRLLDQVTVLAAGEAIAFGSAFHIPARVQIDKPSPPPWSQTAAPYYEWRYDNNKFPLKTVIENWMPDSKSINANETAESPATQDDKNANDKNSG